MVAALAQSLGVSSDSLFKLGIGYLPVVQFKKGPNYQGWWVFPERDHEATVVGLALRGWDGKKVMYPGSKHGLVYEVNPAHRQGVEAYQGGEQNWVRTMDAGIECPVCGKPDGCLLSSEDPDDPKAVICIREPSSRPMEFGFLHIRKEAGRIQSSGHALAGGAGPVVVVEGATDAAAAMDMGLQAVGRPSNLAGLTELGKLVRHRDLIIVGENDKRWNAVKDRWDHPGLDGQMAAFNYLRPHCKRVIRMFPPEGCKDLRDWLRTGLTAEGFLAASEERGETRAELTHLDSPDPLAIAQAWLAREHSIGQRIILRRYRGQWYRYGDGRYQEIDPDAMIRGGLYRFLDGKTCSVMTPAGDERVCAYVPTRTKVTDICDALNMDCPVEGSPPCWLQDDEERPDPTWLISYPNGILDVNRYLDGDEEGALLDPTPDLFTMTTLPYAFDSTATCPEWMDFLASTFDDPAKIDLLQEWFGYNMIPDNSQEKLMLFRGPSRSGKGVTLAMKEAMLGTQQVASTTFDSIASSNGIAQLVGKLSADMPDAVLSNRVDKPRALGTLLSIVGNDLVTIKKLYKDEYTGSIWARFTIAVNELPTLPDNAGALENRMLVIEFTRSFRGKEDRSLKTRLPQEAPGVAVWALEGLRRLRDRGGFTTPESSRMVLEEFRKLSSPISEFLEECCDLDHTQKCDVEKHKLFEAWGVWGKERNITPGMPSRFFSRFKAKCPDVGTASYTRAGKQRSVFTGIKLKPWAEQRLLGRPV